MEEEWFRSFYNMAHNKWSVNRIAKFSQWLRKQELYRGHQRPSVLSKIRQYPGFQVPVEFNSQECNATGHLNWNSDPDLTT